MATNERAAAVDFDVKINGTEVPDADVISFTTESDFDQPDTASVVLRNDVSGYNDKYKPGHTLEILVGASGASAAEDGAGSKQTIFKGEVVGLDVSYSAGGKSKLTVRGFNKLHRLTRGKKSKTYQDQSDQDIVSSIAGANGLSAQSGNSPKITHKHVYQHNQSDLDFLRVRAARLGFSVWVDDAKLYFDAPKIDQDSGIELKLENATDAEHQLKAFSGRLSNAGVVKKVTVRAWNPEKKEEIVGEASAQSSPLGSSNAASSLSDFGDISTFTVDHPVYSVEEAQAIAKAKVADASMGYITADAECRGHHAYKIGIVVKVTVNLDTATDRFNGKYLVAGVTHRYAPGSGAGGGGGGGYTSTLRLRRDAEKGS
ncbi:MAG: hypothetical protein H6709_20840 [Kofleriaceae bacterium]|nr:hypothetical protein [Myxococcales bacterium]MCB9561024.1 hypothetical protein [Kofleriaceae bacterium]MCB9574531.1 hypothetical protein [Kofleriaceae bacterium]